MSRNPFGSEAVPRNLDNEHTFAQWFRVADTDSDGRLTGADAVRFFERSGLPRELLAKVWSLADNSRRGYLDVRGFSKAMDLISVAQRTGEVSADAYSEAYHEANGVLPPPQMMGIEEMVERMQLADADSNPFASGGTAEPGHKAVDGAYSGAPSPGPGGQFRPPAIIPPAPSPPRSVVSTPNTMTPGSTRKSNWGRTKTKKSRLSTAECSSIVDGLKVIYFGKIRPLEESYKFGAFFSSYLNESDFYAKPSVLLLGQYSTGKTTFIKHLLGREYPGIHIGPEPTTDRFVVVMGGMEERRTPGNTLIVQPDKPYQGLSQYGNGFLAKFEAAACPNQLLEEVTLVDTPGVLSGEKQRIERTYDFIEVCGWFAARCDLILLLFDPAKLDISDEMKQVIQSLKGHDDKVRVVLNKADQVDMQQLMRVYGALMWSLGKVFRSPEVCKVYIGSFNADKPVRSDLNPAGVELFEKEQSDLLQDLYDIPQRACDRKVNEFVKRVRAAKIHCLIMGHLRKQMPAMMGKQKAQEKLLKDLGNQFSYVQREHHLPAGDFPDVNRYREILSGYDISAFPKLREKDVKALEETLSIDIPTLVKQFDNPYG
ncbi:g2786 [Coccomyxa viridis]|uniref:G2786 protein n=1 Tax=Coccomyxa viridis TaxID=1274662 RepID=A0ABP1FL90_9CHLO